MMDEWKEFTGETQASAVDAAKGHFSVSEDRLDVRLVSGTLEVSGLGSRVLVLASLKDEPQADLSDVGSFILGVLERMNLANRVRIQESDEDGDLVFKVSGPALEGAVRRDGSVVGALAHVAERAAQKLLGEELSVRIDVPRSERRDRDDRGDGRNGRRRDGREGRGERRGGRGERPRRGDDRGGRRPRQSDDGDERLEKRIRELAAEVKSGGGERVLESMSSRERWIVHNTIKDIDGVTSESIGDPDDKRVKLIAE